MRLLPFLTCKSSMLASDSKSWCIQVLFPKKSLSPIGPMQIRFLLEHTALYFCSAWNYLVCLFIYLWILLKFNLCKSFPNVLLCSQDFLSEQNRQQAIHYLLNLISLFVTGRKGTTWGGLMIKRYWRTAFCISIQTCNLYQLAKVLGKHTNQKVFNPHGCGKVLFT